MSGPRHVYAEGGDRYRDTTVLSVDVKLDPGVGIRVALPYTMGGERPLNVPYIVRLGGNVSVHADREQLVRLRDVLTAALDDEGGESS